MKYHTVKLQLLPILYNLDKLLAIFGILFSCLFIFLGIVTNKPIAQLLGIFLLIFLILWLSMRESNLLIIQLPVSKLQFRVWAIVYFIFYILSIIFFYWRPNYYERPIFYFLLIALMAGVLACEILTSERKHSGFILIQIIILGMNITWTQLLITPGLVGIDPWYHSALTTSIIREGILPSGYIYSKLPIFHIMIAITSIATSFTYKFATLVSVSFGQIACNVLFIFLIGNYLFQKNYRIGLLASLVVIIADLHIHMSYWSIPNTLGAVFITIILYLLFRRLNCSQKFETSILIILAMVVIILTHTIMAICMAILLFVVWGALTFYRHSPFQSKNHYITLLMPMGFTIAMFTWWSYVSGTINQLVKFITFDFYLSSRNEITQLTHIPPHEIIFSLIGQYLFLTITIIGILYMISRKSNSSTFSFAILACTPLFISFIAYLTSSDIIAYRWIYVSEILMSIPLALTLYLISSIKIKQLNFHYLFFFGFIVILSFLMLMGLFGNNDNHFLIPNLGKSNFYTQSELVGSDFFANKSTGLILSDINYAYNPSSSLFEHIYGINRERLAILDYEVTSNILSNDNSLKIIRTRSIIEFKRESNFPSTTQPNDYIYMFNSNFNKIYENPTIYGYI